MPLEQQRAPPIGRGAAVILQLHTLTRAAVKQCLYFQTRWNRVPRHLRVVWNLPRHACADQILSKVGDRLKLLTQCENAVGTFIAPS